MASESRQSHDRHAGAPGEHETHLQQDLQLVFDGPGGTVVEGLGAVATLEQEGLAARDPGQSLSQGVHLARCHQGRQLTETPQGVLHRVGVGIGRLLRDGMVAEAVGGPGHVSG